jgi:hypothetical protein
MRTVEDGQRDNKVIDKKIQMKKQNIVTTAKCPGKKNIP